MFTHPSDYGQLRVWPINQTRVHVQTNEDLLVRTGTYHVSAHVNINPDSLSIDFPSTTIMNYSPHAKTIFNSTPPTHRKLIEAAVLTAAQAYLAQPDAQAELYAAALNQWEINLSVAQRALCEAEGAANAALWALDKIMTSKPQPAPSTTTCRVYEIRET